jgi:hypothetical protein
MKTTNQPTGCIAHIAGMAKWIREAFQREEREREERRERPGAFQVIIPRIAIERAIEFRGHGKFLKKWNLRGNGKNGRLNLIGMWNGIFSG